MGGWGWSGRSAPHANTIASLTNRYGLPARSSVLPVPYAISRTGVLMGVITAGLVSYANSLTGVLLVHVAGATGKKTYEALAEKLGGRGCKVCGRRMSDGFGWDQDEAAGWNSIQKRRP